jgi:hypothetical protein
MPLACCFGGEILNRFNLPGAHLLVTPSPSHASSLTCWPPRAAPAMLATVHELVLPRPGENQPPGSPSLFTPDASPQAQILAAPPFSAAAAFFLCAGRRHRAKPVSATPIPRACSMSSLCSTFLGLHSPFFIRHKISSHATPWSTSLPLPPWQLLAGELHRSAAQLVRPFTCCRIAQLKFFA